MSARRHGSWLCCLIALGQLAVVAHAQEGSLPHAATPAASTAAHPPSMEPAVPAAAPAPAAATTPSASPSAAPAAPPVAPSASAPAAPRTPAEAPELAPLPHAAEAEPAPADEGLDVDVQLGFGFGTKRFERPLEDGTAQVLPDSAFAAIDAGLRLHLPECGRVSLSAALRYRSSLGFRVEESPLFALTSAQDVRVQRLELSARSSWRIGDGGWSPALGVELGVVIASFVPELHDRLTPKYALAGPVLRPIGRIEPLDWLVLQVGPEISWIALVDGSLGEDGVGEQGVGLGAEASARARLFEGLALELDYRATVAMVGSDGDLVDFEDAERFVTLGVVGEL